MQMGYFNNGKVGLVFSNFWLLKKNSKTIYLTGGENKLFAESCNFCKVAFSPSCSEKGAFSANSRVSSLKML